MLCQECHEREAVVRLFRETENGREERHLCVICAGKYLEEDSPGESPVRVSDLLEEVRDYLSPRARGKEQEDSVKTCPTCFLTWEEYTRTGLLGCPDCYRVFAAELKRDLRRRHGTTQLRRSGKTRRSGKGRGELARELDRALRLEDYERAAELRDRMKTKEREYGKHVDRIATPGNPRLA